MHHSHSVLMPWHNGNFMTLLRPTKEVWEHYWNRCNAYYFFRVFSDLLIASFSFTFLPHQQEGSPYWPGPAQGFGLLKGNFSSSSLFLLCRFCTDCHVAKPSQLFHFSYLVLSWSWIIHTIKPVNSWLSLLSLWLQKHEFVGGGCLSDATWLPLLSPLWEPFWWNSHIPLGQC